MAGQKEYVTIHELGGLGILLTTKHTKDTNIAYPFRFHSCLGSVTLKLPGETEVGSAEEQPAIPLTTYQN